MNTLALCLVILGLSRQISAFAPARSPWRSSSKVSGRQLSLRLHQDATSITSSSSSATTVATDDDKEALSKPTIRPLHQNWFPVSIVTALDASKPNAVELLGQKLVLYKDGNEWKCLADRCAHRFAPLSEGRLVKGGAEEKANGGEGGCASCTIQCSYHGWEFNGDGKCAKVPQYSKTLDERKASPVPSYPVKEDAGMIWVWSDPDKSSWELADSIPLPITQLVRDQYDTFGGEACFMRDLPYGMELLGENLLDLSHLPFSHHGVGGLKRDFGGELPLRVMSESERVEYAKWEEELVGPNNYAVPLHQVEILNATHTDPMFLSMAKFAEISSDANATISFFEPAHVRYRRERVSGSFGHVELFMSPTSAGKSRVFLYNTRQSPPPPAEHGKRSLKSRLASLSPTAAFKKALLAKLMNPATARSHGMMHGIFDGDGIFLHMQGERMQSHGRTYRQYSTPAAADVLLNSYRRYLDAAAKLSVETSGSETAANTVSYPVATAYSDSIARSDMLDRYESHTKHCSVCSAELNRLDKRKVMYETARTSLVGAGGASAAALIVSLATNAAVPSAIIRAAAASSAASILGSIALSKKKKNTEKKMQTFLFEDYVHADKI